MIKKEEVDNDITKLDEEPIAETLIHCFNDSHSIKYLETTIIKFVLSEGIRALAIFQDTYLEEMNFPTLFFGSLHPTDIVDNLSYQKFSKWELMHQGNDFATHITDIFFKAIKTINLKNLKISIV